MRKGIMSMVRTATKRGAILRGIAVILCLLLLFHTVPPILYVKAAEAVDKTVSEDNDAPFSIIGATEVVSEPIELVNRRTENAKHFMLGDGTFVAAQYPAPVHYLDSDGTWQEIDNSLRGNIWGFYETPDARIKLVRKINGSGKLFELFGNDNKITLSLMDGNKGVKGQVTEGEDGEEETELKKMLSLGELNSTVKYAEAFDGVDIEYVLSSLNIKENIVVKERKDVYSFAFELKLEGLTAQLTENGDIEISREGQTKYLIPAPVVYDAVGAVAPEDAASFALKDNGNGKYILTVTASPAWMNAENRAFPVTIDPAIITQTSSAIDTYVNSNSPSSSFGSSLFLEIAPNEMS